MNEFYVYVYLDPRKPGPFKYGKYKFMHEPIYVGKGKNKRAYELCMHNGRFIKQKIIGLKKKGVSIIINIFMMKLKEKEALKLEQRLISKIGRFDLGKGPLVNCTDGGEKGLNKIIDEEYRRKISEGRLGKKWTKEQKEKVSGVNSPHFKKSRTEEERKKISEGMKGRIVSKETKKKISESLKRNKYKYGGKPTSPEVKEKISRALKGRISPTKGMHFPNRKRRNI
jgi:hypothetical protein